jgi:putative copper export protein
MTTSTPTETGVDAGGMRRLPGWAWLLAAVTYPAGIFVALAAARVMRWRLAVPLAIASYAFVPLGGMLLERLDRGPGPGPHHLLQLLWIACIVALGFVQYHIGKRRGYWTDRARRRWKIFGVTAVTLLIVDTLALSAYAVDLMFGRQIVEIFHWVVSRLHFR